MAQAAAFLAFLAFLGGCNTGSGVADSLTPTAEMRNQAAPPAPIGIASETALAADRPRPQGAADLALRPPSGTQQQAALSPADVPPVAFLPVTGAPQSAVSALALSMRAAARTQQVPVVVSMADGARYQIKGYLSATSERSGINLVYIWDVLDANGVRIHRISGQEVGPPATGDPWSGVSSSMMESVAQATMAKLRTWIASGNAG